MAEELVRWFSSQLEAFVPSGTSSRDEGSRPSTLGSDGVEESSNEESGNEESTNEGPSNEEPDNEKPTDDGIKAESSIDDHYSAGGESSQDDSYHDSSSQADEVDPIHEDSIHNEAGANSNQKSTGSEGSNGRKDGIHEDPGKESIDQNLDTESPGERNTDSKNHEDSDSNSSNSRNTLVDEDGPRVEGVVNDGSTDGNVKDNNPEGIDPGNDTSSDEIAGEPDVEGTIKEGSTDKEFDNEKPDEASDKEATHQELWAREFGDEGASSEVEVPSTSPPVDSNDKDLSPGRDVSAGEHSPPLTSPLSTTDQTSDSEIQKLRALDDPDLSEEGMRLKENDSELEENKLGPERDEITELELEVRDFKKTKIPDNEQPVHEDGIISGLEQGDPNRSAEPNAPELSTPEPSAPEPNATEPNATEPNATEPVFEKNKVDTENNSLEDDKARSGEDPNENSASEGSEAGNKINDSPEEKVEFRGRLKSNSEFEEDTSGLDGDKNGNLGSPKPSTTETSLEKNESDKKSNSPKDKDAKSETASKRDSGFESSPGLQRNKTSKSTTSEPSIDGPSIPKPSTPEPSVSQYPSSEIVLPEEHDPEPSPPRQASQTQSSPEGSTSEPSNPEQSSLEPTLPERSSTDQGPSEQSSAETSASEAISDEARIAGPRVNEPAPEEKGLEEESENPELEEEQPSLELFPSNGLVDIVQRAVEDGLIGDPEIVAEAPDNETEGPTSPHQETTPAPDDGETSPEPADGETAAVPSYGNTTNLPSNGVPDNWWADLPPINYSRWQRSALDEEEARNRKLEKAIRTVARNRAPHSVASEASSAVVSEASSVSVEPDGLEAKVDRLRKDFKKLGGQVKKALDSRAPVASNTSRDPPGQLSDRPRRFVDVLAVIAFFVASYCLLSGWSHSQALVIGYGPYFNSELNGLGGVISFHSWEEFALFLVALLFLFARLVIF